MSLILSSIKKLIHGEKHNKLKPEKPAPQSQDLRSAVEHAIQLLQTLHQNSEKLVELTEEQRVALVKAAGEFSRPSKTEIRLRNKNMQRALHKIRTNADRRVRAKTGIRQAREATVFTAPEKILVSGSTFQSDSTMTEKKPSHTHHENNATLQTPRNCYVCKALFTNVHHFYDSMCPTCAEFNYEKRFQTADLTGQVALITGSRLKIGYQSTLMMLRAGAKVFATTRFPIDSALRFSRESDYEVWKDRLHIHGLDLRHTPSVELFARFIMQSTDRLDILINNAAQTVRRPPGFYAHLMPTEKMAFKDLPPPAQHILKNHIQCVNLLSSHQENEIVDSAALTVAWHGHSPGIGLRASAQLSQIPYSYDNSLNVEEIFPQGQLDADLQQVDLRTTNSWRLRVDEVPTPELLEVQLVNSIAPYVLCNKLIPLMKRDFTGQKHIVNVTAMEGKFYRFKKNDRHPHTNMAKAALNMLTHTAAGGLAKDGIFMNAVDTGWVTDEDPAQLAELKQTVHDFQPPLDIVDGAARVCDPFFNGIRTGSHWCGKFLKDYMPTDW